MIMDDALGWTYLKVPGSILEFARKYWDKPQYPYTTHWVRCTTRYQPLIVNGSECWDQRQKWCYLFYNTSQAFMWL